MKHPAELTRRLTYLNAIAKNIQDVYKRQVVAGDYGLWVAYYSKDSCDGYWPEAPMYPIHYWSDAAMLQYTSGGRLAGWGDRLDLNVFYGDHAAWDAYAGGGTGVTPQP